MEVYSVFVGFCHSALQSFECVCVERGHVCIHKAHFPSSPCLTQLFCLHWCRCSFVKVSFYLHQTPFWIWLTHLYYGMDQSCSRHNGTNNAQTPPYYNII